MNAALSRARVAAGSSLLGSRLTRLSGGAGVGSGTRNLSGASNASKPVIAVVAGDNCPSMKRMPAEVAAKFEMVRVGKDMSELQAQKDDLARCQGILWIPMAGAPSAPSDVLNDLWSMTPNVNWVHSYMAGVDGIRAFIDASLLPAAETQEIRLSNGRGAFSWSLGEYALAAVLYFNKQLKRCEANRGARVWDNFVMDTMNSKTVGLVGYGSIGKACGRAIKGAFGCEVLALRRNAGAPDDSGIADKVYGFEQKQDFFAACDYVICSLPSTANTQKFIGATEFQSMKDTAVLVSVGRGAAIDEAELERALREKTIHGAALDVFVKEPLPKESGIWDLDNVLLTAHNADFTEDYFELGWTVFNKNLENVIAGKGLETPVDLKSGY